MKNTIIASATALVIGFFLGHVVITKTPVTNHENRTTTMNMSGSMQHTMPDGTVMGGNNSSMSGAMASMMVGLQGKTGDDFDKAFISEMVMHHEGAVDMAEEALKNAKHQEIKNLANAIISAQNKEITDMKAWYKAWYGVELK